MRRLTPVITVLLPGLLLISACGTDKECFKAPPVVALGSLSSSAYYANDCPGGSDSQAIVVAGVRLCPDSQVLGAVWPSYPEHSYLAAGASEPVIDDSTFNSQFAADVAGANVAGAAWTVIDADLPRASKQLLSGASGTARRVADDPNAPPGGAPMSTSRFTLIGSVSKFVSSVFFLRMLEDLAADSQRNPAALTVPQLLELPAWHFLPQDWKFCINNAACGVSLSEGESAATQNESFKTVRIRDLLAHTSGLGKQGADFGTERLWGYMVTGTNKYNLDSDGIPNNVQGNYAYENVNIRFLAALFYGLTDPIGRAGESWILECDDGAGSGDIPSKTDGSYETWANDVLITMIGSMHGTISDLRAATGTPFTYSCDVPGNVDIDGNPLPAAGTAYVYPQPDGGPLGKGAWFSSESKYPGAGCPPQGSFWTSIDLLGELLWDVHNGFFLDDRLLPMITAYENPAQRLIFDPPVQSPWLENNLDWNDGNVNWKGGDQPVTSSWLSPATGKALGAGDYSTQGAHAAIVFLPFGQYAIAAVNSDGMGSSTQATELKNSWVEALYAANPGSFMAP